MPASHCAISTNAENDVSSANDRRRSTRCFFSTHRSYRSRYPTTPIYRVTLTLYAVIKDLLDCFYPEREITVTTSDPRFVTPAVIAMLRRKNRFMHAGRVEEANALARLIRTVITRRDTAWLRKVDTRTCARAAWTKVRDVIGGGKRHGSQVVD